MDIERAMLFGRSVKPPMQSEKAPAKLLAKPRLDARTRRIRRRELEIKIDDLKGKITQYQRELAAI